VNGMLDVLGSLLLHVVPFLLVLSLVVTIHELGHFWVARAFGVKVDQFSIGFGKRLWGRTDRHGIEWRIGALPLGGYVKFSGDLDASSVPDQAGLAELKSRLVADHGPGAERDYFHFKPVWQRALIVAAGPAANFVLAAVLFTLVFSWVGEQVVAPRVVQVTPGSPAAEAGFQRGDLITAIDDRPVVAMEEVTRKVVLSAGERLRFDVRRGTERLTLTATPERVMEQDQIAGRVRIARIGMGLGPMVREDFSMRRLNPVEAMGRGFDAIGDTLGTTLTYLGRIFTGRESGDLLSGPLGIAKAAGGVTQQAVEVEGDAALRGANLLLTLLQFAALVSIGIGFVNLLPIPVLDGGHLMFYGYEAVARRPVPAPVQEAGFRVGLALLAGLMLFATWNDLQKLNLFAFLGGLAS
jgi:regulator of sigma E protease